jgi:hypothetical protein
VLGVSTLVLILASAGLVIVLGREPAAPEPLDRPRARASPVAAASEAEPTVGGREALPEDDPPWARVEQPKSVVAARPTPRRMDAAPDPTAPPREARAEPRRSDVAAVGLASIDYSPMVEARRATLILEGGRTVTLRQGEAAAGVEVQLILPDMVYVHVGADVFALSPDR